MLPLHRTFKSFAFVLIFSLILVSCVNHSKQDAEIIKALNESIENSNRSIAASSIDVLTALKSKLYEWGSVERTKVWLPRAEKIQQLSKDVFDYIESTKRRIKDSSINSHDLFEKLKVYRNEVLQIDPKITDQFQRSLKVFTLSIDSSNDGQEELFQSYFKNVSVESTLAILNKLQNNILFNEMRIVTFCNEQIGRTDGDGFCTSFSVISILNSSVVQPGGNLEVISGIGEFNRCYDPQIFVYKKSVPTDESGVAIYKIKAPSKPGKYYVPVKINYTDQNGKQQSIQKEIEYIVANIQKQ